MFGSRKPEEDPKLSHIYNSPEFIAPDVPMPSIPGDASKYTVAMMGKDDPENALNLSTTRKGIMLVCLAYVIMVATWGSAIGAPAIPTYQKKFHLGLPVATLTVSLYVVGFAVGPIVWGPLSNAKGRKIPMLIGSFGLMLFMFAAATAKDWQTIAITRFFQGVFGASSLTVGPAIAGDAFSNTTRGSSITVVTFCVIAGPMIAPIVGGYITQSFLGWRWTMYLTGIMAALACILLIVAIPETYAKTILQKRASRLRQDTGNWAIRAPGELEPMSLNDFFKNVLVAPVAMLIKEAILGLVSLYHGFIYGILYMCLEAVPIIFAGYGFPGANVYLPYIAILVGAVTVCSVNMVFFEPWYNRELVRYGKPVLPEKRLVLMIVSGVVFTLGIFLMCWSGAYAKHVHWIVPMVGGAFVGFGIIGIFLSAFNYLLDTYLHLSAMAFAANTFLRSAFGCAFPLFVHPLFTNLGVQWAGTLVGCLAALMIPVPVAFYFYGAKLRSISPFAINLDDIEDSTEKQERENTYESSEDARTDENKPTEV